MIISQTPLRISFVGGGTDIKAYYGVYGGQVISASIDKYIYVIVKKRYDNLVVLHYTENEIVSKVADIKHEIIREALLLTGIESGIEIITLADITTKGSGLGSSSVLTVGLLNALYQYQGIQIANEQLAQDACFIEIDRLKKPIGKQDQYIAAYGGVKKILFHPNEKVTLENIRLSHTDLLRLNQEILLHNTHVTRSADNILEEQSANVSSKIEELTTISQLVDRLDIAFNEKKLSVLGDLLRINWEMKKQLAKSISTNLINDMVTKAMLHGATGCKIAGAGGGGFLMSYVPFEKQETYRNAMRDYQELTYQFDPMGTRILLNVQSGII